MNRLFFLVAIMLAANCLYSATYFVSTNGDDSNNGTSIDSPLSSIVAAVSKVSAGDSILVMDGIYHHAVTVNLSKNGTQTDSIFMLAFNDEHPILDFSGTAFGKRGISLSGSYWKIKGFEMMNAGDNAMFVSGANNTIEFCSFHDNKDTGLQLGKGAHDNKIINCDSYFNADPTDFGDADGFAAKLDVGSNNYFYGCRAWNNVDDGWDGYMRGNDDVNTILENCWTWSNGYFKDGTDGGAKANGNGFKVGGSDDKNLKHNFTLINCLAFFNKSKGFDQNNNMGDMFFYNCTGFGNEGYDFSIPKAIAAGKKAEVKNCVLFNGNKNLASFVVQENNSWDSNFEVDESDFVSIDTTGVSGARKPDGSLPDIAFMHLAEGSDLVDAGIDLQFEYIGKAPDLGAFESNFVSVGFNNLINEHFFVAYQTFDKRIAIGYKNLNKQKAKVNIYNSIGQLVANNSIDIFNDSKNVYVFEQNLQSGVYVVVLLQGTHHHVAKLIVE
ncbi:MAG TPA: right-handed parallel beta-helix repeat-containing protein [Prolixibacteraceae bacterium]|nr:right-handed parallel beta-helix repeat-containing protein [Prolixibacteraceae bacterium]